MKWPAAYQTLEILPLSPNNSNPGVCPLKVCRYPRFISASWASIKSPGHYLLGSIQYRLTTLIMSCIMRVSTFTNPICAEFSLKHCLHVLRPYFLISPCLLPQIRLCKETKHMNWITEYISPKNTDQLVTCASKSVSTEIKMRSSDQGDI